MVARMTPRKRDKTPAELPELLTVPETASALRVGVATVRTWIAQGTILASRPGKQYLIPTSEVERLGRPQRRQEVDQ